MAQLKLTKLMSISRKHGRTLLYPSSKRTWKPWKKLKSCSSIQGALTNLELDALNSNKTTMDASLGTMAGLSVTDAHMEFELL